MGDKAPGDGIYGLAGPGDPGEPGVGDQAGEYPGEKPLASDAALGEKPAAPGVIPLPTLGDQAPYAGVAPVFQGVMAGDMPLIGLGAEPKNMPVGPATLIPGMLVGISMPYLHFSASNSRSKQPVPAGAS